MSENKPREWQLPLVTLIVNNGQPANHTVKVIEYQAFTTALDIINKMQAALEYYANPKSYASLNAYQQSPKCILADKDCEVLFKEIPQKYAGLKARSTLAETSKLLEGLKR